MVHINSDSKVHRTITKLSGKLVAAVSRGWEKRRWFPASHWAWETVLGADWVAETAGSSLRQGRGGGLSSLWVQRSGGCHPVGGDRRTWEETLLSPMHSPSSFVSYLWKLLGKGFLPADLRPHLQKMHKTPALCLYFEELLWRSKKLSSSSL